MKKSVFLLAIAFVATSCDVYYLEPEPIPVYDPRDQFLGSYDIEEYNPFEGRYFYSLSVYKGDGHSIVISNLYNAGISVYADVRDNRLYILSQVVDGYAVSGNGVVVGNSLLINYSIRDTYIPYAATFNCQATGYLY